MGNLKTILCALAATTAANAVASPAATQDWVRNYVSTNSVAESTNSHFKISGSVATNGYLNIRATLAYDTNKWYEVSGEYPYVAALVVSNCSETAVSAGVTNGMLFAWDDNGKFWNGDRVITASSNCYYYAGVASVSSNGFDRFDGYFDFRRTALMPSVASNLIFAVSQQTANVRRFSLMSLLVGTAFAADAGSRVGGGWEGASGAGWYTPESWDSPNGEVTFTDADKNPQNIPITRNKNGQYEAGEIGEYYLDARSAIEAVLNLSKQVYQNASDINKLNASFKKIGETLDDAIGRILASINEIKDEVKSPNPDDGGTETIPRTITVDNTKTYYLRGGDVIKAVQYDNITIGSKDQKTANERLQLKNFPGATAVNVGLFPIIGNLSGRVGDLMWFDPWGYLDGDTINIDRHSGYEHMPSKESGKHGIHLAGWYNAETAPYKCEETIAMHLTNSSPTETHYVLTKIGDATEAGALHYMRIGRLGKIGGGSGEILFRGDDGGTVTEGVVTTNVIFRSGENSNVGFAVGDDSEVQGAKKVTVEVRWAWY